MTASDFLQSYDAMSGCVRNGAKPHLGLNLEFKPGLAILKYIIRKIFSNKKRMKWKLLSCLYNKQIARSKKTMLCD